MSEILHATAVARPTPLGWEGALLRGPSGAGKSGLALRLTLQGWRLVADDRVIVWASGGRLFGRAPGALTGLIEARGVGVLPVRTLDLAPLSLIVDLAEMVERMPDPEVETLAGVDLPRLKLRPNEAEAPAKLALAMTFSSRPLGAGR